MISNTGRTGKCSCRPARMDRCSCTPWLTRSRRRSGSRTTMSIQARASRQVKKGSATRILKRWLVGLAVAVAAVGLSPGVAQAQASQPSPLHATGSADCPAGDLEGAFKSSAEMAVYLDCVLPSVAQWIDATYTNIPHPTNYYFVPVGYAGTDGDGGCLYDETSLQYCPSSGNIYLGEAALWAQYSIFGDAAPVVVLAHEVT